MSDVVETKLPGVGIRMDFTTKGGDRLGMISHRAGHKDLLVYDRDDPASCGLVLRLEEDDARTLGDLLGGDTLNEELAGLQSIPGLTIDWVPVRGTSRCSNSSMGQIGAKRDLGAQVVAVIRGEDTIPSPPDDFVLRDGDTAVAVGTPEGVRTLFELLQGSAPR
jgi:TrkA domain protein